MMDLSVVNVQSNQIPPEDVPVTPTPSFSNFFASSTVSSDCLIPVEPSHKSSLHSDEQPSPIKLYQTHLPVTRKVVREGWLMKRGEHIKNWRRRYFKLREDGTFYGYKCQPKEEFMRPLNNFTVRDCQIILLNKPKPFSFILRGLQWIHCIDRLFFVENQGERAAWVDAIQSVANRLRSSAEMPISILSANADPKFDFDVPERPIKRYSLSDFRVLKLLGKGSFGKVVLCEERETGCAYAMKILKKSVLIEKDEVRHTITENRVLQQFRHPFMTQLHYSFSTPDRLYFVMEYVNGGELYFHLSRERCFTEQRTRFYAAEITLALGYLHSQNVVYRDLKLENLLLDKDGHIKITDFGLCKEKMCHGARTKTFCGTPEYLAPEMLLHDDYGRSVDWWGLGVVTYEMMYGQLPFYSTDLDTLFELIAGEESINYPMYVSSVSRDFLSRLLVKNPVFRLGSGHRDVLDIMDHPFFSPIDWEALVRKDILPPWKPDVADDHDTKYIPDEFKNEPPSLSPLERFQIDDVHFEQFSFHGSLQSVVSHLSNNESHI